MHAPPPARRAAPSAPRRAARRAAPLALAAANAAAGCRSVADPPLPGGAVPLAPPAVYARWWALTEACSGLRGDAGAIAWYVVPGAATVPNPSDGGEATGYYSRPGARIVLAGRRQLDGGVVRHEMLHALLGSQTGHPRDAFLARCAGVVRCEEGCVRDAGPAPPPPPGTLPLDAASLAVGVELAPAGAGTPGSDAWYTLTVSATNPAGVPVDLADGPLAFARNFGYVIVADPSQPAPPGGPGARAALEPTYDASVLRFGPSQTKRYVFDLRVVRDPAAATPADAGDVRLAPGTYLVRGAFGVAATGGPAVTATLSP